MRQTLWVLAVGLAIAVGLAAPGASAGVAARFPLTVTDATGNVVVVPSQPRRIISLAPSVTEILFALGLDREIVGLSDSDDYPPDKVQAKVRIGGVAINFERVVSLRPDLVIGIPSLQRDQLGRLKSLGLTVLAVDAASIEETIAQVSLLGRATGRTRQADELVASIQRRAQVVQRAARTTVYIEVWNEPVIVATGDTLINDLVTRAGGVNIFADRRGYAQVPLEAVLVRNPQVIFLLYPGRDRLRGRPGWRAIEAARNGRITELPTELVSRPGPRIVEGLALVSRILLGAQ
ncbi:MAG: ABC transporter substrate-binding protein [Armatimonadota bacterium]